MNNCDGCIAQIPLENGYHKGKDLTYCTKDRYMETSNDFGIYSERDVKSIEKKYMPEEKIEFKDNGNLNEGILTFNYATNKLTVDLTSIVESVKERTDVTYVSSDEKIKEILSEAYSRNDLGENWAVSELVALFDIEANYIRQQTLEEAIGIVQDILNACQEDVNFGAEKQQIVSTKGKAKCLVHLSNLQALKDKNK